LFSGIAVTEGVVLFDALPDALNLLSFTLVGFATIEFIAMIVAVLFSTATVSLDGKVTLVFAVVLLEAVGFVGAEVMVEVFEV
jgi:hypothetical protein